VNFMELGTLFGYWALGVGGGVAAYVVFSLLGMGIYRAVRLLDS
jgi:hypothetical protein